MSNQAPALQKVNIYETFLRSNVNHFRIIFHFASITSRNYLSAYFSEIYLEPQTSEETLSSYTSLKPNRDPPSIYQPLRGRYDVSHAALSIFKTPRTLLQTIRA